MTRDSRAEDTAIGWHEMNGRLCHRDCWLSRQATVSGSMNLKRLDHFWVLLHILTLSLPLCSPKDPVPCKIPVPFLSNT